MTYFVYLAHALNCNTKTNGTKIGLLLKTVDTGYAAHICFICTGLRIRDRGNATRLQYMYMAKATLCIFVVVLYIMNENRLGIYCFD